MEISNYLSVIRAHKLLIKANMNKLPKYLEHMYGSTDDELKDELTTYKKEDIINGKYYGLLENVARFINKYDLDKYDLDALFNKQISQNKKFK